MAILGFGGSTKSKKKQSKKSSATAAKKQLKDKLKAKKNAGGCEFC